MTRTEPITGAEYLARSLAANGTSHVFFIDAVLRPTLIELGTLGVTRVLGHSEKAVAYMADGYARIAGRPGICFAQSVGAANLAAGLQDAYLGRSPVIAMTGRKQSSMQHRNAYQEIPHHPLFAPVTKFSAEVDQAADLPRLMRQAWREAMSGTPRPTHLDLNGLQGEVIETGMVRDEPTADPSFPTGDAPAPAGSSRSGHRACRRQAAVRPAYRDCRRSGRAGVGRGQGTARAG
jgi:acetolactate synthase-1/2/3 large subunit